jgi:hypothetical protein
MFILDTLGDIEHKPPSYELFFYVLCYIYIAYMVYQYIRMQKQVDKKCEE